MFKECSQFHKGLYKNVKGNSRYYPNIHTAHQTGHTNTQIGNPSEQHFQKERLETQIFSFLVLISELLM